MSTSLDRGRVLALLEAASERGLQPAEVTRQLGLAREDRPRVRWLLKSLEKQGIVRQEGRSFRLDPEAPPPPAGPVGQLRVTAKGTGLVRLPDETGEEPISVAPEDLGGALDGDEVALELLGGGRRPRGRVLRIVRRGRLRVTGAIAGPPWRLVPDDSRLVAPIVVTGGAERAALQRWAERRPAPVILAEITGYPGGADEPLEVTITRELGEPGELVTEVARLLAEQAIGETFSAEVMQQAERTPDHVRRADHVDRVDLRDRSFVTIDPETARDFDDAVAIEDGPAGCARVWVAVADVGHYVEPGSPIDAEAYLRGCSLYLPDRAIPMLPTELSSGICSLVPQRDRLAMVVRMDIDAAGKVVDAECMAAIIHSRGRLDYAGVAAAFAGRMQGRRAHYREHIEQLQRLREIARQLRAQRMRRGSLDLDLPEAKVVLDDDDPTRIRDIVSSRADPAVREAYNLIEELMIAANEAVGRWFEGQSLPTIWRVHEPPELRSLEQLGAALASYGIVLDVGKLEKKPKQRGAALQKLLRGLRDHPAARPLTYLVLRSLKQACYQVTNRGHFGLASASYLHFTSPIRRYPDLIVHRLVKRKLRADGHPAGGRRGADIHYDRGALQAIAEASSRRERTALDLERQIHSVYAARLMRDRLGDDIEGVVVGFARSGVFVSLDGPAVDGMVRLETLPEYVRFDPQVQRMIGSRSGRVIALGDRVRVQIAAANVIRRQIDFELLEHAGQPLAIEQRSESRGKRRGSRRPSRPVKAGTGGHRRGRRGS